MAFSTRLAPPFAQLLRRCLSRWITAGVSDFFEAPGALSCSTAPASFSALNNRLRGPHESLGCLSSPVSCTAVTKNACRQECVAQRCLQDASFLRDCHLFCERCLELGATSRHVCRTVPAEHQGHAVCLSCVPCLRLLRRVNVVIFLVPFVSVRNTKERESWSDLPDMSKWQRRRRESGGKFVYVH